METFGKVIVGGFIGAIINAVGLLFLGLIDDYFYSSFRTIVPVSGAFLGIVIGGLTGGLVGLIQPKEIKAVLVSTILLLLFSFMYFTLAAFSTRYDEASSNLWRDIIYLMGFNIFLILSVWMVAKIAFLQSYKRSL